jgi:osmoprotectant transport system substrate-binding protein
VLAYAPAQDRNGFVVAGDMARRHGLEKLSDLTPMASRLSFGGPAECAQRVLCLKGLEEVYKLQFKRFEAMPTRTVTADALGTGEIDVGMIDTTDPNMARPDLVQLADDKRLQPADNVVPVVRREVLDAYGPPLVRLLNAISAQLTTPELIKLNLQVYQGRPAADTASGWLRTHTII